MEASHTPTDIKLSSSESDELTQYRSLNVWAVLSLVVGLLSPVALWHPALWWVPVLAMALASLGRWQIARSPEVWLGRWPAALALVLGGFFLVCAPVRYLSLHWLIEKQSEQFVLAFTDAVREGRLQAAHQATLEPKYRQPVGTDLADYYQRSPEEQADLDAYFNMGVAKALAALGKNCRVELQKVDYMVFEGNTQRVVASYAVFQDDPLEPVLRLQTDVHRITDRSGTNWWLVGFADANAFNRLSNR